MLWQTLRPLFNERYLNNIYEILGQIEYLLKTKYQLQEATSWWDVHDQDIIEERNNKIKPIRQNLKNLRNQAIEVIDNPQLMNKYFS